MSELSIYVLSVAGVVILSVLIELIMPEGQMNKYTKSIMSLVIIFVIVSPLPKLAQKGFNFSVPSSQMIDQNVLDTVKNQQILKIKKSLEKGLAEKGFENVDLLIQADLDADDLKISSIFVDLSNLVLTKNNEHILTNEAVEDFLLKQTGLKAGQVVFYG